MKKKFASGMNIGTSSILITFVLLMLVCFAALSFLSANSDYSLSMQAAKRTTEYYQANKYAEIYLANVEALLSKKYDSDRNEKEFYKSVDEIFTDADIFEVNHDNDEVTISYDVDINDKQFLSVCLLVHYPTNEDPSLFHIRNWKTRVKEDWKEEVENELLDDNKKLMDF